MFRIETSALGIPEVPSTSWFAEFSHEVSDEDALARIKEEDWEVIEVRSEGLQDWRYEEQVAWDVVMICEP